MKGKGTGRDLEGAVRPPLAVPVRYNWEDEEPDGAWYARAIVRVLAKAREIGMAPAFGPDATAVVTLRYVNGEPVGAAQVAVSVDHADWVDIEEVREIVRKWVLLVFPDGWMCDDDHFLVSAVGESKKPGYTRTMTDAAAFAAAARTFSDRELKEYVQKGEVAAAVLTERETTTRAKAAPRPDWVEARKRGVKLADFITEKFAADLADRSMSRAKLRRFGSLYQDYYNHLPQLPPELQSIPTKSKAIDRAVAEGKVVKAVRPPAARSQEVRDYERTLKQVVAAKHRGMTP